jgi:hypothetical protein
MLKGDAQPVIRSALVDWTPYLSWARPTSTVLFDQSVYVVRSKAAASCVDLETIEVDERG